MDSLELLESIHWSAALRDPLKLLDACHDVCDGVGRAAQVATAKLMISANTYCLIDHRGADTMAACCVDYVAVRCADCGATARFFDSGSCCDNFAVRPAQS